MQFALVAHDRPNSVARRLEMRPEHLKHLDSLGDTLNLHGAQVHASMSDR